MLRWQAAELIYCYTD